MRNLISTCTAVLLLLIDSSFSALTEWQKETVDLCRSPLRLVCIPSTRLIIRRAAYQSVDLDVPQGDTTLTTSKSLLTDMGVEEECYGKTHCEPHLDELFLELACGIHHELSIVVDVEYACASDVHLQRACGEEVFTVRDRGFVVNERYPKHNTERRCTIIFKIGMEKLLTVRPMTLDVPAGWETRICNLTQCEWFSMDTEQVTLTGNSHIRIAPEEHGPAPEEQLTFAFEYEVFDMVSVEPEQDQKDAPRFDQGDVGVIKLEKRTKTAAIAAGVAIPVALIAILATVYIYQTRQVDRIDGKLADDQQSESSRDPCFKGTLRRRPNNDIRVSWGNGCQTPSLPVGSFSI